MCFALEGRVLGTDGENAMVDFDGVSRSVNAAFIKVKKGDSVLVFNGFVIERL